MCRVKGFSRRLLKIMEGTVASVPPQGGRKHPQQEFLQVDTTNILFICWRRFRRSGQDYFRPRSRDLALVSVPMCKALTIGIPVNVLTGVSRKIC